MIIVRDIALGVFGAARLAQGDAGAIRYFGNTSRDFWVSFVALALALPAYSLVLLIDLGKLQVEIPVLHFLLVQMISYAITWLAFAWVMVSVTVMLNVPHNWVRFIGAHNWASLLQAYLIFFVRALHALGLPNPIVLLFMVTAVIAIVVYEWWIARVALEVRAPQAILVVLIQAAVAAVVLLVAQVFIAK